MCWHWWQVRQFIKDRGVSGVGVVEQSLEVLCPTTKDPVTVLKKSGSISRADRLVQSARCWIS